MPEERQRSKEESSAFKLLLGLFVKQHGRSFRASFSALHKTFHEGRTL